MLYKFFFFFFFFFFNFFWRTLRCTEGINPMGQKSSLHSHTLLQDQVPSSSSSVEISNLPTEYSTIMHKLPCDTLSGYSNLTLTLPPKYVWPVDTSSGTYTTSGLTLRNVPTAAHAPHAIFLLCSWPIWLSMDMDSFCKLSYSNPDWDLTS